MKKTIAFVFAGLVGIGCAGQGAAPGAASGSNADKIIASDLAGSSYGEEGPSPCLIKSISFENENRFKATYASCPGPTGTHFIIAERDVAGTYKLGRWDRENDTTELELSYKAALEGGDADQTSNYQVTITDVGIDLTDSNGNTQSLAQE
jgi:hypothetical protein